MSTDLDRFRSAAAALPWTYAKTMPASPHDYVVRGKTCPADLFDDLVLTIRRHGEPGKFYRQTLIYLVLDEYRYWTMGAALSETIIINRAPAGDVYGEQTAPRTASTIKSVYDDLAPAYDARYDREDCHVENGVVQRVIFGMFDEAPAPVLDIGAGTGLALDLRLADPSRYTAVDPSQAMLNELVRKHPTVRDVRPEPFTADTAGDEYGLILALFGAASYLTPAALDSIPSRLAVGGHAFLMAYMPDYYPDYYETEPASIAPAREAMTRLPGALHARLGNYHVVTLRRIT